MKSATFHSCHSLGLSVFNFTQLFSKSKQICSRRALTCDPTVFWCLFDKEPARISAQSLYCQKLEWLPKICAADSMSLSLLAFTQLFSKVAQSDARQAARKQNLTRIAIQGHSRSCILGSLKSWRRTACRYNNAGLISKVNEEIACINAENCQCRQPHCRLTPPSQGINPGNICINLILPESRVIGQCLPQTVWVYLHSSFRGGLWNAHVCAIGCATAVECHPRSLILAPIERAYATFL